MVKLLMAMYHEKNRRIEALITEFRNELFFEKKQLLLSEITSCYKENEQLTNQLMQPDTENGNALKQSL